MKNLHTPGPWEVDLKGPFTLGGDMVSINAVFTDKKGRKITRIEFKHL